MGDRGLLVATAVLGACGVVAGAAGAHALTPGDLRAGWLATGSLWQLVHAVAALACLRQGPALRPAAMAFLVGAALFPGALYGLALGAPRPIALLAPLGGLALLLGWLLLAIAAWRRPHG
jgi:uncharacterized membrane protein YgdD (TMEM256/DUF423 family)